MNNLKRVIFCGIVTLIAASTAWSEELPTDEEFSVLVDQTIVPMVRSFLGADKKDGTFDVVIVDKRHLREKLSKTYVDLEKLLRFEDENAVVFKGHSYLHKKTEKEVYLNKFFVVKRDAGSRIFRWSRICCDLGGTSETVTMKMVDGKWKVTDIKLESVS